MDTTQFFAQAIKTAQANMQANLTMASPAGYTARHAAKDALDEAHSSLSQPAFFGMLDALGEYQALVERIEKALVQDKV